MYPVPLGAAQHYKSSSQLLFELLLPSLSPVPWAAALQKPEGASAVPAGAAQLGASWVPWEGQGFSQTENHQPQSQLWMGIPSCTL